MAREAPAHWQLLDEATDHVPGLGSELAERELLAGRTPAQSVLVAVIDGGVDTAHVDLKANLWTNPGEIPGNGKDDDGNGYVDDIHGWDFIGGPDGKDVRWDTFEVTREQVLCNRSEQDGTVPAARQPLCQEVAQEYARKQAEAEQTLAQLHRIDQALSRALPLLQRAAGTDSLTAERVTALTPADTNVRQARQFYLQLAAVGITPADVTDALKEYDGQVKYGYNLAFDPRGIVGDNYTDLTQRDYGNNDVMGPDAQHGTHVSGIIGAVRGNGVGVDGIAPAVKIMMIRTIPDGDERDKDVANAIRYAVDNGARIINMSFGKDFSPAKAAVDNAVRYADAHGVLMVHAAGNDGADLSKKGNYPTPFFLDGTRARNWIEVGASSWKGLDSLAASFSNYGHDQVDVFAPGEDIVSTVPGNGYKSEDGTSMAAPMVSGVAALLMAYFPDLTAADVKRIILASATRYADQMVVRPGSPPTGGLVPFGQLSATGGIVNAYAAVKQAVAEESRRQ